MVVAILAAILAAILDFSVSSQNFACYPPDFHYRGANDAKSTVKKPFIIPSRVDLGGTLTKINGAIVGDRVHSVVN